jgi:hypothetical protein
LLFFCKGGAFYFDFGDPREESGCGGDRVIPIDTLLNINGTCYFTNCTAKDNAVLFFFLFYFL